MHHGFGPRGGGGPGRRGGGDEPGPHEGGHRREDHGDPHEEGFGPHHGGPGRRGGWFMQPPIWGFLQPCLLLLLAEGPKHGYSLIEELNRRALLDHDVDIGNLYRALRRMEAEGLVTSAWSDKSAGPGPNKRVYQIAPDGEEVLQTWAATLEQRLARLNHFLDEYHQTFGQEPTPGPTQQRRTDDEIL